MAPSPSNESNFNIKACSINICGMSEKSRFMLDKYSYDEKYDLVYVQESGTTENNKIELTNMNVLSDDNEACNKGALIYANNSHSLTKLKEINQMSKDIDTSWGITVMKNKRFIVGSVYLKLNYLKGIEEFINMLNKANELKFKFNASGIIVMGDFNARHSLWGDTKDYPYGKRLIELLDVSKFSICHASSPTFLCSNGGSCIDLMIVSNNLVEKMEACTTDKLVELNSGAPDRGHVPLIANLQIEGSNRKKVAMEKINTDMICWEQWSNDLEHRIEESKVSTEICRNAETLGNFVDTTMKDVTLNHAAKKVSSPHSKPYWTAELTRLCDIMRQARKNIRREIPILIKKTFVILKKNLTLSEKKNVKIFLSNGQ